MNGSLRVNLHCNCLNVKEILARNTRGICKLIECNVTRLQTQPLWIRVPLQTFNLQISRLFKKKEFLDIHAIMKIRFTLNVQVT